MVEGDCPILPYRIEPVCQWALFDDKGRPDRGGLLVTGKAGDSALDMKTAFLPPKAKASKAPHPETETLIEDMPVRKISDLIQFPGWNLRADAPNRPASLDMVFAPALQPQPAQTAILCVLHLGGAVDHALLIWHRGRPERAGLSYGRNISHSHTVMIDSAVPSRTPEAATRRA